jgi:hypothetical protein
MELHTLIGHGLMHSPVFALLSKRNNISEKYIVVLWSLISNDKWLK